MAEPQASPAVPARWKTSQVFLGVFICWQIWFLLSQNILGGIEAAQEHIRPPASATIELIAPGLSKDEGQGHFYDFTKWVLGHNKLWMHLTGQAQSWGLFSDGYKDSVFPALILRWDDDDPSHYPLSDEAYAVAQAAPLLAATGPFEAAALAGGAAAFKRTDHLILTPHEPVDIDHYFRWRQMRMRRYENNIVITLSDDDCKTEQERDEYWGRRIKKHLDREGYLIKPYVRWRYETLKPLFAGNPPKQVVLVLRRFRTTPPDETPPEWRGPFVVPLLSWEPPADEKAAGRYTRYDPEAHAFRSWE
ncbi:MAG: hypothetical protein U0793_00500 [Gemmataceae bacterium]